jgi:hypothetical protein
LHRTAEIGMHVYFRRGGGLRCGALTRRNVARRNSHDHAGAAASDRVSIKLWAVRLPSKATVAQRKGKTSDSSSLR